MNTKTLTSYICTQERRSYCRIWIYKMHSPPKTKTMMQAMFKTCRNMAYHPTKGRPGCLRLKNCSEDRLAESLKDAMDACGFTSASVQLLGSALLVVSVYPAWCFGSFGFQIFKMHVWLPVFDPQTINFLGFEHVSTIFQGLLGVSILCACCLVTTWSSKWWLTLFQPGCSGGAGCDGWISQHIHRKH